MAEPAVSTGKTSPPLPSVRVQSVYCFGQVAEGLFGATITVFLLFYYNQVLGLSGSLCGLALLIALCFDAITDPMVGSLSDGWHSRLGRRHPFMYLSAIPLALSFFGLFNPPVEGEFALFCWLAVFAVLARGTMTLFHIPHLALVAEITPNFDARTRLVAWRQAFGSLGMLIAYGVGFGIYFKASESFANGQLNPAAYLPFSAVLAVIMALVILLSTHGTRALIPFLPRPSQKRKFALLDVIDDVRVAGANLSFRWLVLGFIIVLGTAGVAGALSLHVKTFFWQLTPRELSILFGVSAFSTLIGYAIATPVTRLLDKRGALMIGAAGWGVVQIGLIGLKLYGWFPEPGTLALGCLIAGALIQAVFGAQVFVATASMLADITDQHLLASGKQQAGIFFGAFSFSTKAAQGLGVAVGGIILDLVDWPVGKGIRTAADIPPDTLVHLAVAFGPVLAMMMIPAIWCVSRYTLTREAHARIRAELDEPRPVGRAI